MNDPNLSSGNTKPESESATRARGSTGAPGGLDTRIERSALWAAYGDALGWISELTDAKGLKARTGGAPLHKPVPWKRRIGGRSGVMASLPRGCYSDDSQLRLATSRAIRADGFDIEAFARVELPIWLSYGLGGGRSTSAAATQLGRTNSTWWSNQFKGWTRSGGNGAAMRVQPHVWAARDLADTESYLPDVIRNAICTHSHPTGLMGAVLHAFCVAHAMRAGEAPSPDDLLTAVEAADCLLDIISGNTELGYWRVAFEQEAGGFDEAWAKAMDETRETIDLTATCKTGACGEEGYGAIVKALGLCDPARRGSGMLTAVAAVGLTWCEARPAEAMRIAANAIGTDTDTIATMAGAVLGATADADPPVDVLDVTVFRSEARRLAKVATGESPSNHEYPDLLHWSAPKTRADALFHSKDGGLFVRGLGRAQRLEEKPVLESGEFRWQWIELEFGQTLLIKSRHRLPDVEEERTPLRKPAPAGGNGRQMSLEPGQQALLEDDSFAASYKKPPDGNDTARMVKAARGSIQDVVSYMEKHIDDDEKVGKTLRRVVRKGTTGEVAAFNAALIELLRNRPEPNESR